MKTIKDTLRYILYGAIVISASGTIFDTVGVYGQVHECALTLVGLAIAYGGLDHTANKLK